MSKSGKTAKTASKNNPTLRKGAEKFFFNGKEIEPIKLIKDKGHSILAAVFADSQELVLSLEGTPLSWKAAKSYS